MSSMSRRAVLLAAGGAAGLGAAKARLTRAANAASAAAATGLKSLTAGIGPITLAERRARLAKAQALMQAQKIRALLVESGSTLDYFTGVVWHRSERTTAAVIPAQGGVVIVTPAFEEPSVRETLQVDADVRVWNEDQSPFAVIAGALRDRGAASGPVAAEGTTRFFIVDGVRRAAGVEIISGDPVVRPCRMIKSPAELALMQAASNGTRAALRYVHAHIERGMSESDIASMMDAATVASGGTPEFSLVLLNEASAYPHGSKKPQAVREGSVILMDCGCTVHGYQSDISRS
jgi:Xaa-Pro dipeptidase